MAQRTSQPLVPRVSLNGGREERPWERGCMQEDGVGGLGIGGNELDERKKKQLYFILYLFFTMK